MIRSEIIEMLRQANVHVYSKTFAGKEEIFVEGRIEYFENFVKALGESAISICEGIETDSELSIHEPGSFADGALVCKEEIKEYFRIE